MTLLDVPDDAVPMVVDALSSAADQRGRAAVSAAATLETTRRGGGDIRSKAVKVVGMLAEAAQLRNLAAQLHTDETAESSHVTAYDAAAAVLAAAVDVANQTTMGIVDPAGYPVDDDTPPLCLHEAWEQNLEGEAERCTDCGQVLPSDWTGPHLKTEIPA